MRRFMAILAVCVVVMPAAPAAAQQHCTQETMSVKGTALTIGYCLSGAPHSDGDDEIIVPVTETYGTPSYSAALPRQLHFVAGEGASRILESIALSKVGMTGVLHLTLVYTGGLVHVEGALLTPGAITIK
jgi:hypothetical protein